MKLIEMECQCNGCCGSIIKVPRETKERASAFKDLLISKVCPNTDLDKESIIKTFDTFVLIFVNEE